jgi:ABC-type glycerol-3-phosphate transport system substrate-binding protein
MSESISRRRFIAGAALVAGATVGSPLLAACGDGPKNAGPGTTDANAIKQVLPTYTPSTAVTADIPSVAGVNGAKTDPAFFKYPDNPVQTVTTVPGKGGTYTTRTPLWGAIPSAKNNAYYEAVNKGIGATLKVQPADGNSYVDGLPPLFASGNLPDWFQIPSWANAKLNLGQAVGKLADLTPYLSGNNIAAYPNLANIPPEAWQCSVWNGKLYGLPCYPTAAAFPGYIFYRKDILDTAGVSPDIKSADELFALGKDLTNAKKNRWAFDDMWPYLLFPFGANSPWSADSSGKLIFQYEQPGYVEALNFAAKLAKSGYVHPDALTDNQNQLQRFWSGKVAIAGGGTGAWNGDDAKGGKAANPDYNRHAFAPFSANGGTPGIQLGPGAGWFGYLNAKLSADQIKEVLAIANYLAAPYGSQEYLTVNYGAEGTDYTMKDGLPALSDKGSKEVATSYQFLVSPPAVTVVQNGYQDVVKDFTAWQAEAVKAAVKPMFFGMNVSEPAQYSSIGQSVDDAAKDVRYGRKPISAFTDAVKSWKAQGGDQLRAFYEDIRTKYGTGQ